MADTFKKKDMGDMAPENWKDHVVIKSASVTMDQEITYSGLVQEKEMLEQSIADSQKRIKDIESEMASVEAKAK